MMRVLLLYPYLPAPDLAHGSARLVSGLLSELRARAADLHLTLLCAYRPSERQSLGAVEKLCDRLIAIERRFVTDMGSVRRTTEATATGLRLLQTGYPLSVVKLRRSGITRALEEVLREGAIDLVHVELSTMAQYVEWFPHLPSVLVDHEAAGPDDEAEDPRWPRYAQTIYPRFHRVLCLSAEDALDISRKVPGLAPLVRPPAIRAPHAKPRAPMPGRILFFGSLDHEPNKDALAWIVEEILPALRRVQPHAHCVAAGFEGLDGAFAARALEQGVECLGFVPDLAAELARAALVLSPVRLGHGVRIKNLETIAHGVPLVTTSLGMRGLPTGLARVADEVQGLVQAVAAILVDPQAAEARAAAARAVILERHAPAAEAEFTLDLWRELCG